MRPGRIVLVRDLSDRARLVGVETRNRTPFFFSAGQHVKLGLASEPGVLSGPYSIASPPDESGRFDVLMNLVLHATNSPYEAFKEGVEVQFKGPKGKFFFSTLPGRRAVFVAGGTGIAPLRSMILDESRRGFGGAVLLVLAARRRDHLYFVEDWERIQRESAWFKYVGILSEPDANWKGLIGFPMDHADLVVGDPVVTDYYLCGPPEMVKRMKDLLSSRGADPARIFTEG